MIPEEIKSPNSKDIHNIIQRIDKNNLPDKDLEIFWYGLKHSIRNFCRHNINDKTIIYDKLSQTSVILNYYKDTREYDNIHSIITSFLCMYSIFMMNSVADLYHTNIFITNIKRWEKISDSYNYGLYDDIKKRFNLAKAYHKILKKLNSDNKEMITNYYKRLDLENQLFIDHILELSYILIECEIPTCLDYVFKNWDIHTQIKEKFKIDIYKTTKADKLIRLIKGL